jgi:L-histidine N-alpha-methyltransferase
MWLRADRDVHVYFRAIDTTWDIAAGAEMLTEISVKFDLPSLHAELREHGQAVVESWTDAAGDFSLTLAHVV